MHTAPQHFDMVPQIVAEVLTWLFAIKTVLLTMALLVSIEWVPTGWRRRRAVVICLIALTVEFSGMATLLMLTGHASEHMRPGDDIAPTSAPGPLRPDR